MTISILQAARQIGIKSSWSLSNLKMQKLLYIAHMFYLAREDEPLVWGEFEAWDYGPVHPELYHRAKIFGADPVQEIFRQHKILDRDSKECVLLDDVMQHLGNLSGARLVAITHWSKGAWAKNYIPGVRGKKIPNSNIVDEYNLRSKEKREREKDEKSEPKP